jgi:dTDP-4-amino-4,6-dideoxygalactose transaminase
MLNMPIMRPKLPVAERLTGYLRRIDETRFYTNFGPLVCELEERLAEHYRLQSETVTSVANATLGLALSLMAQEAKPGTLCAMPAWTFIASAHAACNAGLIPYFIDVEPESWALEPSAVIEQLAWAPAPVGAVMPVAPFGLPIDVAAWDEFRGETGLPVVIDAAAGFDSLIPGNTPAVVSLHATKVLSSGEGGIVVSRDQSLIRSVRSRSNFGFHSSRLATYAGTNAKLSEYHAAVGLAALDEWRETRTEWMNAAAAYRRAFDGSNRIHIQDGFGQSWVSSTCVLRVDEALTPRIEQGLASAGIETRQWWGQGAHLHPATSDHPRAALGATEALAAGTFAVPFYRDLAGPEIRHVAEVVLGALDAA